MGGLKLKFNLTYPELYSVSGLLLIDNLFLKHLQKINLDLYNNLIFYRQTPPSESKDFSNFLIELAQILEYFMADLFHISDINLSYTNQAHDLSDIFQCKRNFIQRIVAKKLLTYNLELLDQATEFLKNFCNPEDDLDFAKLVNLWLEDPSKYHDNIGHAGIFAAHKLLHNDDKYNVLYYLPKKIDPNHLLKLNIEGNLINSTEFHHREGFSLLDHGGDLKFALDQANYCIFCHNQGKDSCSKGLKDKDSNIKINESKVALSGCPLEEKISEMNTLKSYGLLIAPLAMAMVDNPLLAMTGHRICNDCMKSCIYQKQEPVDIPQIETRTLKDVLDLDYGVEIYSLLTRWNPLNAKQYLPLPSSGYRILVVGMGPAGINASHHLLNAGHDVVGIDGLKIEPLNLEPAPIKSFADISEDLSTRVAKGFGGVAEYGITVRWNKNYLTLVRILLERRMNFMLLGGIRFGSNITLQQAYDLGFDHIVLAIGAGKPNLPIMQNTLAKGVKTASDFLMSLQLTGAANKNLISNLQIRFPVVVIGGGLTAIDAATEAQSYYIEMLKVIFDRIEKLPEMNLSEEDQIILEQYRSHYELYQSVGLQEFLQITGGVTVAYRGKITDSPSYRLNHEELQIALDQGIKFIENVTPHEVNLDEFGHACSLTVIDSNGDYINMPASTILIATGTSPNTTLADEFPETFVRSGKYFQLQNKFMVHIDKQFRSVSTIGDSHPKFFGNVVKAMASGKKAAPFITEFLTEYRASSIYNTDEWFDLIYEQLSAKVVSVNMLTGNIVEVILYAPLAAQNFEPGQFYRLQNFAANAIVSNSTIMATEGIAVTGAWVDKEQGLISTIILEMGGSSSLCRYFEPGEPVVLMGPTGSPTHIPKNQTVMLIGGGLGNAVLFSIGKALKNNGCKVLYFAGYKNPQDRYKIEEIEAASDIIVWCCDNAILEKHRDQDYSYQGNIIEAIEFYANEQSIALNDIEYLVVIGSDRMMGAVAHSMKNGILKELLANVKTAVASINSPMQCMMKEICAQCLQEHINPETGQKYYVYSCVNQDQDITTVNFDHLNSRLKQNSLAEKITAGLIQANFSS